MSNTDDVIRITKEEATSEHVDDLLKRQMSLRGEPGVTKDRKRKWYYQNWFVLMLAGILGAIGGWSLYEPFYDDYSYLQGTIEEVDASDEIPFSALSGSIPQELHFPMQGSFNLAGKKVFLLAGAKRILPDGAGEYISLDELAPGQKVGAYIEYYESPRISFGVCSFIKRDPTAAEPPGLADQQRRNQIAALLLFSVTGAMVGLFIGAADGIVCRLPRRAFIGGLVGLLVGFVGGILSVVMANMIFGPLSQAAIKLFQTKNMVAFGFLLLIVGRSLAWGIAGMAMGLGQGIALRSKRLLLFGFMGGVIGGLLGGLCFDPIEVFLVGDNTIGAHWSRLASMCIVGGCVGAMIGIVELLARDAWLQMTQGPLAGKEFLIYNDLMNVGSSPRSDLYLFNDPAVAEHHATIRSVGDQVEIEAREASHPVLINGRSTTRARLRHGDQVIIGQTAFVFQQRKT